MGKKYEFTGKEMLYPVKLKEIRALRDFGYVKKGDIGGYIESESCLSHEGNCWVYPGGMVYGKSIITHNAVVGEGVTIHNCSVVGGNASVLGKGIKINHSSIGDNSVIEDGSVIINSAIEGKAVIRQSYIENAKVSCRTFKCLLARIIGIPNAKEEAEDSFIRGNVKIYHSELTGRFRIYGDEPTSIELTKAENLTLRNGCFVLKKFNPLPGLWLDYDFFFNPDSSDSSLYFEKRAGRENVETITIYETSKNKFILSYSSENPEMCFDLNPSYSLEEFKTQIEENRMKFSELLKILKGKGIDFCNNSLLRLKNAEEFIDEILEKNHGLHTMKFVEFEKECPARPYVMYKRENGEMFIVHDFTCFTPDKFQKAHPDMFSKLMSLLEKKSQLPTPIKGVGL